MSRGVKNLILNDIELKNINVIKKNFERIGVPNVQYSKEDALQLLKNLSRQHSFDVIFADPPYEYLHYSDLIDQIFAGNILKANGYFILEHDDQKKFDHHPNLVEHRKYGKVHFSFFQHLIP
jgi:16S rRNA G966 N2-methylase RsmD